MHQKNLTENSKVERVREIMENKQQCKRGLWKPEEDLILRNYVETYGEGNWAAVSKKLGLTRGGKSCRLRWKNYLRPNIKRGGMSKEEEDLIIRMHKLIGNRWSLIAGRLPGRTDNEVKNYWNTHLNKKCRLGKRKAMDLGSTENNNDKILPRPNCGASTSQQLLGGKQEEKEKDEKNLANYLWMDDSGGSSFHYDIECGLISPNNNTFVFDDEPFIAYLDSFVLFETFERNQ